MSCNHANEVKEIEGTSFAEVITNVTRAQHCTDDEAASERQTGASEMNVEKLSQTQGKGAPVPEGGHSADLVSGAAEGTAVPEIIAKNAVSSPDKRASLESRNHPSIGAVEGFDVPEIIPDDVVPSPDERAARERRDGASGVGLGEVPWARNSDPSLEVPRAPSLGGDEVDEVDGVDADAARRSDVAPGAFAVAGPGAFAVAGPDASRATGDDDLGPIECGVPRGQRPFPATVVTEDSGHAPLRRVRSYLRVEGVAIREDARQSSKCLPWCHHGPIAIAIIVVSVGAAVGAIVATVTRKTARQSSSVGLQIHSLTPSMLPSENPTAAPTSARFKEMKRVVRAVSNEHALANKNSPQFLALEWMAEEDERRLNPVDSIEVVQRFVVALIYFSMDGGNWKNSTLFLSDRHECSWFGILCHPGTVVVERIDMVQNNLGGTIPSEIGVLRLKGLHIFKDKIGGSIPASIRNLGQIEWIDISENKLIGTIPDIFDQLPHLAYFDVGVNNLSGRIPRTINNHTKMTYFKAYSNSLHGTIPWDFNTIPWLTELLLHSNMLSGTLPESIGDASKVDFFAFSGNGITGTIPESLSRLPSLELLGLHDNSLHGTIPASLFDIRGLVAISVGGNELTGTIPENVGNQWKSMRGVALEDNYLTGTIPVSLGNPQKLEAISMHSNYLTGTVPASLGNLTGLRVLELANNRLTGSIPESFRNLVSLEWFSLPRNGLSGSLNFLCDLNIFFISADCKGDGAEVECDCCVQCCHDKEASCSIFLSTDVFIKDCIAGEYCFENPP